MEDSIVIRTRAQKLASDHWKYIEELCKHEQISPKRIKEIKIFYTMGIQDGYVGYHQVYTDDFHYVLAYKHGRKHREQDSMNDIHDPVCRVCGDPLTTEEELEEQKYNDRLCITCRDEK